MAELQSGLSRRRFLSMLVVMGPCVATGCTVLELFGQRTGQTGASTPACFLTAENPEGPFFIADAPLTNTLRTNMDGEGLRVSGVVSGGANCTPLAGAMLDVWHASPAGDYDMSDGFYYRARVQADAAGQYAFETLVPGNYGSRPAHIHMRISAPGHSPLITQLYFEGDPANATDRLVIPSLIIPLDEQSGSYSGVFNITLA
jgi:protocatechuate 3,4-dioxygenase beta subunit